MLSIRIINVPVRSNDMYLFMLPSAFFLFALTEQLEINDKMNYRAIRKVSSLVFYTHLWIAFALDKLMGFINGNINKTSMLFLITTIATIIISCMIYKLSLSTKGSHLKMLYE